MIDAPEGNQTKRDNSCTRDDQSIEFHLHNTKRIYHRLHYASYDKDLRMSEYLYLYCYKAACDKSLLFLSEIVSYLYSWKMDY